MRSCGDSVQDTDPTENSIDGTSAIFSVDEWARIQRRLQFTDRQLEIVQLFFDGHSERRIAFILGVTYDTVHTHVKRIYRKLDVTDQRQLLVRVFAEHLSPE